MKKEAEIKIIEQIGTLIDKLAKADSYFRDDLRYHDFDFQDIDIIKKNIRSDFPLFSETKFKKWIERVVDVYQRRADNLAKMLIIAQATIRVYRISINDLEAENKTLRQFKHTMLANLLEIYYATDKDSMEEEIDAVLKSYPDEEVMKIKLEMDYPLTQDEKTKLMTALTFRS